MAPGRYRSRYSTRGPAALPYTQKQTDIVI